MANPKMTTADLEGIPRCPHCEADLYAATVTIESLMDHYPFGGMIAAGDDGYAREEEHLTADCPSCHKPIAIGFNSGGPESWFDWTVKFVAARTHRDGKYLVPDETARFFDKAIRIQAAVHCGEGA